MPQLWPCHHYQLHCPPAPTRKWAQDSQPFLLLTITISTATTTLSLVSHHHRYLLPHTPTSRRTPFPSSTGTQHQLARDPSHNQHREILREPKRRSGGGMGTVHWFIPSLRGTVSVVCGGGGRLETNRIWRRHCTGDNPTHPHTHTHTYTPTPTHNANSDVPKSDTDPNTSTSPSLDKKTLPLPITITSDPSAGYHH